MRRSLFARNADLLPAVDTLKGTNGDDTLEGTDASEVIQGLAGNDSLIAGGGLDTLYGGEGNDTLLGGANEWDILWGEAGDDLLILQALGSGLGGDGDDVIQGSGTGTLDGDDGNDTIVGGVATGWLVLQGGDGNDRIYSGGGGVDNKLYGEAGADVLEGSTAFELLDGGIGQDRVRAGPGDDKVYDSDADADTLRGGAGMDELIATWASEVHWVFDPTQTQIVNGNTIAGFEHLTLRLGNGNDEVEVLDGAADIYIAGGGGNDHLTGGGKATSDLSQVLDGGIGDDTLVAGGQDTWYLPGGAGNDLILGGDGTDLVYADPSEWHLQGNDTISCGAGDDEYSEGDTGQADTVDGGAGIDTFKADWNITSAPIVWHNDASQVQQIFGNTITGFERLDVVTDSFDDIITNTLYDTDDYLHGNGGNDSLAAGAGNDTLIGGTGNDTLLGGAGNDEFLGQSGRNVLHGGAGLDRIGSDADGIDTIVLDSRVGHDDVFGFASGTDRIAIRQAGLPVGDGDAVVDGAISTPGGGFAPGSELVLCTKSTGTNDITPLAAAAVIGDATAAYAVGQTAVFVVHNADKTAVFYFRSAGTDADVSAAELTLLADLKGVTVVGTGDFVFAA